MLSPGKLAAVAAVLVFAGTGLAVAQNVPSAPAAEPDHVQEMMRQHQGTMPTGAHAAMHPAATAPTLPGQDAFGAIQEIVGMLDSDPNTDWSRVNLEALRQHLIDMNEVTLKADAAVKTIDGGLQVAVTGNGRTLIAIQRLVPDWADAMSGYKGWSAKATPLPNGELLTVTTADPNEVQHIRGLGFIGLIVSGSHHQMHHLLMAKGEFTHLHLKQMH